MPSHPDLENILACPSCHSKVRIETEYVFCLNPSCALVYPVKNGIPVMLIEEAKKPA